jgi:hypothetical protein
MDLSKLSLGDKLAVIGGIIAIIGVFLPWYRWSSAGVLGVAGVSTSASLMDASGGIAFLIIIAAAVCIASIVLRMMEVCDISEQGVPEGLVVLIAAAVLGAFTLLRVASIPGGAGAFGFGRTWGLWVGLVAAVVCVWGALMNFEVERA